MSPENGTEMFQGTRNCHIRYSGAYRTTSSAAASVSPNRGKGRCSCPAPRTDYAAPRLMLTRPRIKLSLGNTLRRRRVVYKLTLRSSAAQMYGAWYRTYSPT